MEGADVGTALGREVGMREGRLENVGSNESILGESVGS